ncbi:MAG: beta-lactamase family protein [Acidiferrobacterales bacterium]|nr:beta-lactamase family protein [Acidiferrobacterales bacterium]
MKKLFKIVIGLFVLVMLVGTFLYLQDPVFWKRYQILKDNGGILPQSGWAGSEHPVQGGVHSLFELADSSSLNFPEDVLNDVSDYAEQRSSSSLLVWHKGQLQLRKHFQGTDANTPIVGKSMAKMVVSMVVARAIKEGYIAGLDEQASNYITEWKGTPKETITLRHMLHMAAGFEKYYTLDPSPFGKFMRSYIGGNNEEIMINDYEMIDQPGSKYDYSQVTSDLIGLILERATGKPYGAYLSESLIQPIGAQGGEVMMNRPNGLAHTGCCLLLPSESWLRMGILLINAGEVDGQFLFPDNWMQDYLQPSPANPAFGLHIWLGKPYFERRGWATPGEAKAYGVLHSEPYLADDLFLFDGNGHQVVYIVPSLELVVVRTGGRPRGEGIEWDNSYIPNTLIRALQEKEAK